MGSKPQSWDRSQFGDLNLMRFPAESRKRQERRARLMALPCWLFATVCLLGLFGVYTGIARGHFAVASVIVGLWFGWWLIRLERDSIS